MLIGNKNIFAIEIDLLQSFDGWVYGRFQFWIDGISIGNIDDDLVDLKGCVNWLRDFIENRRNRYEPDLYEMDKDLAFLQLYHSVFPSELDGHFVKEKYNDTYSRFHIAHLGMSSFDNIGILLIESEAGQQRCIWQHNNKREIKEYYFDNDELQETMLEVIKYFEKETQKIGDKGTEGFRGAYPW